MIPDGWDSVFALSESENHSIAVLVSGQWIQGVASVEPADEDGWIIVKLALSRITPRGTLYETRDEVVFVKHQEIQAVRW